MDKESKFFFKHVLYCNETDWTCARERTYKGALVRQFKNSATKEKLTFTSLQDGDVKRVFIRGTINGQKVITNAAVSSSFFK